MALEEIVRNLGEMYDDFFRRVIALMKERDGSVVIMVVDKYCDVTKETTLSFLQGFLAARTALQ